MSLIEAREACPSKICGGLPTPLRRLALAPQPTHDLVLLHLHPVQAVAEALVALVDEPSEEQQVPVVPHLAQRLVAHPPVV